jgi:hypothetical protein
LVRAYFGNERLDSPEQCELLNAIYEQMWVYYNLFQPVMHLIDKQIVGGKPKRKWDEARTPYQRLLESEALREEPRAKLASLHLATNPRQLKREIHQMRDRLWEKSREVASPPQQGAMTTSKSSRAKHSASRS